MEDTLFSGFRKQLAGKTVSKTLKISYRDMRIIVERIRKNGKIMDPSQT